MAKNSQIQWTDHTWNIAVGCTKVDEDCKYCYMYRGSLNNKRYDPKQVRKTKTVFNLPLTIKEPSKIFVSSLTDVFHPDCDRFRNDMWDIIRKCPQHTFQILTKRPERIKEHLPEDWGNGWENVWLGTSIGMMKGLYRIQYLAEVPSLVRFISFEPLHQEIIFTHFHKTLLNEKFHWAIIGGESGNETGMYGYRPCEFEWLEKLVGILSWLDIKVFVKQMGTYLSKRHGLGDRHGSIKENWPPNLQVREFPVVRKEVST